MPKSPYRLDKVGDLQTVYLDHPRIIITKAGG